MSESEIALQNKIMHEADKVLVEHKLSNLFSYRLAFWLGYKLAIEKLMGEAKE